MVMDENSRKGDWLIGSVTKVLAGSDGVVRATTLKLNVMN